MPPYLESLEQLSRPETMSASDVPLASMTTSVSPQQATIVAKPQRSTDAFRVEGSNTSTLSQILAWVSAAKGDFRGLQSIEETKRATALGKAIHPEMLKINELTNAGKWEEAATLTDQMAGAYGPSSKELAVYFGQMRDTIKKRQEGHEKLKAIHSALKAVVKPGSVQSPVVEAFGKAVENKEYWSESMSESFLTRVAPHVQNINDRVSWANPWSQEVQSTTLPRVIQRGDVDNFIGMRLAGQHGLTSPGQLADILNDTTVKGTRGVIEPGSDNAVKIKAEYSALLPLQARLDAAKTLNLDPLKMFQSLKEVGFMNTLLRQFSPQDIDAIERDVMSWMTEQEKARIKGGQEVDVYKPSVSGYTPLNIEPTSPNFLRAVPPMSLEQIRATGGSVGQVKTDVYEKQVQPLLFSLEGLNIIPTMLQTVTPTTRGDQFGQAVNDLVSSYISYPLTKDVDTRQVARTIITKALNAAESIPNIDSKEIATLRRFAANPFNTNEEMISIAQSIKERLNMALTRAIGGQLPTGSPPDTQLPPAVRGRSTRPAQPNKVTTRGKAGVAIDPELDRQLQEVEERARRGELPPGTYRLPPPGQQPTAPQAIPQEQPAVIPSRQSEQDIVNEAFNKRRRETDAKKQEAANAAAALAAKLRAGEQRKAQ